jgi:O-antigen ligase
MNWRGGIIQIGGQRESALVSMNLYLSRLKTGVLRTGRFFQLIQVALPLAIVVVCLFGYMLDRYCGIFRDLESVLPSVQWMLLVCLAAWCGTFLFLTFNLNDLLLIALLVIAVAAFFIGYAVSQPAMDAIILLAGVTLGKGVRFALMEDGRWKIKDGAEKEVRSQKSAVRLFLIGLVALLAFASWWHLDVAQHFYPAGVRWTGLWDNPNIYGMLMGAGVMLAIGLIAAKQKAESGKLKLLRSLRSFVAIKSAIRNPQSAILFIAVLMMGVGLLFSYSRGAWVGTAVGLLYLAKVHGRFKWRSLKVFLLSAFCFLVLIFGVCFFWNSTSDTGPWYLKRMDLSRASAQHRVSAWRGAVQMMRDHPFGVGWNKAVETYDKNYSPPEDGAAAITTNDYLMLGTQLGFPGLVCFVTYVALCFRKCGALSAECGIKELRTPNSEFRIKTACRAGALTMLVAFWFDGGLFKLATAAVFWILLELGTEIQKQPAFTLFRRGCAEATTTAE